MRLLQNRSDLRISEEAVQNLNEHLEDVAEDIADQAAEGARHADRRTIQGEDIELAIE
ncbi:NFYB/HAP3 family transcription factor subunit (plasmid) [Natrinema zhouii]|nr:histone [Natrinema zhouii]UHQ98411.1 NFYB/HAP3 family transcription factor subunit [Natrinema zhouii]